MIRNLLLASLFASIAITGCSRKTETNDPDQTQEPTQQTEMEVIEESTTTETDSGTATDSTDPNNTGALSGSGDDASGDSASATGDSSGSESVTVCTPEWFEWVNTQVMSTQSEAIAEQYPTGLPDVGSTEWFMAVDKLTGGDGAHGPDGGSDEWCAMMQQRLGNND